MLASTVVTVILIACAILVLITMFVFAIFIRVFVKGLLAGRPTSFVTLVAMRFRGIPLDVIVDAYIMLAKTRPDITIRQVENAYSEVRNRIRTSTDLIQHIHTRKSRSSNKAIEAYR